MEIRSLNRILDQMQWKYRNTAMQSDYFRLHVIALLPLYTPATFAEKFSAHTPFLSPDRLPMIPMLQFRTMNTVLLEPWLTASDWLS